MADLNHFNAAGEAHMVDVADKAISKRIAIAVGRIVMQAATVQRIQAGEHHKGDVLGVARIAGIMACKRTSELIPLCHPIGLTHVDIEFQVNAAERYVECKAQTETLNRTGVEIEALCAVQIALLTIYDMCKSMDRGMQIESLRLLHKSGGQSGQFDAND